MNKERFNYQGATYKILGPETARIVRIIADCDHFIVPSVVFSPDGQEYKVNSIYSASDFLNDEEESCFNEEEEEEEYNKEPAIVNEISFDILSEIEEIPISFIFSCKSNFYIHPKAKRINTDDFLPISNLPIIHISDKNKFISVIGRRITMNNYPLALKPQFSCRSRLYIRETVRIVDNIAYNCCKSITTVFIPQSVEIIGVYSFHDCSNLHTVVFKGNPRLKIIETHAFSITSLKKFDFPSGIERIGDSAFSKCENLLSITFHDDAKITTIPPNMFSCSALTKVIIPQSVEVIDNYAFNKCSSLSLVTFQDGSKLKIIGESAFSNTSIRYIDIPSGVEEIRGWAFSSCINLITARFSSDSKLKLIGPCAFDCSGIEKIVIPASVETIQEMAFVQCINLTSVTYLGDKARIKMDSTVFMRCP